MCWARFFGLESNVNHPLASGSSSGLDLTPDHSNFANLNSFHSRVTLEPSTRFYNQDIADHLGLTHSSIIQKLASLDVALYECGLKLPFPLNARSDSAGIGARKSKLFALDELFRLTTEFLDILTHVFHEAGQLSLSPSSTIRTESGVEPMLPLFTNSQQFPNTVQSAGIEENSRPFWPQDEAIMFRIIACHCRLTEIYVSLFKMMHACIEHSLAPRRDKDWAIILPQLQVGSIIASPPVLVDTDTPVSSTTSSTYMLMITMVSSQVWEQLADKMRLDHDISMRMGSNSILTEAVWGKVTDRNDCMFQTINKTRHLLQQRSVVAVA
jgi:hypothetical protein